VSIRARNRSIKRTIAQDQLLVARAIARISFAACPLHTEIKIDRRRNRLRIILRVNAHETGELLCLELSRIIPLLASVDQAIDWIYACTREAWVHELNEVLLLDGTRRHDLHDSSGHAIMPPDEAARGRLRGELKALNERLTAIIDRI
jgi:hypothetical protein